MHEQRVVAGMNVNVWDVNEHGQALIRSRRAVAAAELADPGCALAAIAGEGETGAEGLSRARSTAPGTRRRDAPERRRSGRIPVNSARRRARRQARGAVRAAIAFALVCGLGACGAALPPPPSGTQNLSNIAQIQTAIEDTVAAKQHLHGTAYCPTTVPALSGETFSCVVAIAGRRPAIFTVTEVNSSGDVTYAGSGG